MAPDAFLTTWLSFGGKKDLEKYEEQIKIGKRPTQVGLERCTDESLEGDAECFTTDCEK